jgi:hypothetical protein
MTLSIRSGNRERERRPASFRMTARAGVLRQVFSPQALLRCDRGDSLFVERHKGVAAEPKALTSDQPIGKSPPALRIVNPNSIAGR